MKKILLFVLLLVGSFSACAEHLKGGFFTYRYIGPGSLPNTLNYQVTLTVYMYCQAQSNAGQLTNPIPITFFDAGTQQQIRVVDVPIAQQYQLSKSKDDECISGEQRRCYYYIVVYNLPSVELPANTGGYIISYQRCCRIADVKNIGGSSNAVGNTYSIKIPGSSVGQNAQQNTSANFQVNDTAVVCAGNFFTSSFSASDADGDSLSYFFCDAWTGGGQSNTGNGFNTSAPNPSAPPLNYTPLQYPSISYSGGFNGSSPLGSGVTIDPRTGLISGIAPAVEGEYVVTVCVNEYRNGVLIAGTRKELHILVGDCSGIKATLNPSYITCDGFTLSFLNNTPDGVLSTFWDFGVLTQTDDTSNIDAPTFTYPDTGTYTLKLVVNRSLTCADSTTTQVKVYPGFFPGFRSTGICVNTPTQFTDTTRTTYGTVSAWHWNFGDAATLADTSVAPGPAYTYTTTGTKTVEFIVSNSKGCTDTVLGTVNIIDKPPLSVAFKDTLICSGDTLQLFATGPGVFSWSPATNIINPNTANPLVFPTATTPYTVTLNEQGCINTETVNVRVVNFVTLTAMPDSVICEGDSLRLTAITDGLRYLWDNAATLNDATLLSPMAKPVQEITVYRIVATIGRCTRTDEVQITMVPYPIANAGKDTTVCFGTSAQLNGTIVGNRFVWSPVNSLTGANTLTPIATPRRTATYVLSAFDTRGCPKPGTDTVVVTINPRVVAFAGRDTAVIAGQPLQLTGTGGVTYQWSPAVALNNPFIFNPRGVYNGSFDSVRYTLVVKDSIGCADTATVLVKIFRTDPRIFVPTGFTPNGDGRNDFVAPVAVGISKLNYFRIFNRWGQKVFETTVNGKGWDGRIAGQEQGSSTFVWIVQGVDYTGKVVFAKGTVTLIR